MKNQIENIAGVVFSPNNRRFLVDKQSEGNLELSLGAHFEGGEIPEDAGFVIQSQVNGLYIIKGSEGYAVGECIRDNLGLQDALFVEARGDQLLVVLCREGIVQGDYLTAPTLNDALIGDLLGLDTPLDLIAVHQVPESILKMMPEGMQRSLRVIEHSVLDNLNPAPTFELLPFKNAVKRSGIYRGELLAKVGVAALLILGGVLLFWPSEKAIQIDPGLLERTRLQNEYQELISGPGPFEAAKALSSVVSALESSGEWELSQLVLNKSGELALKLEPVLPGLPTDAEYLSVWADEFGFRLQWKSSKEAVAVHQFPFGEIYGEGDQGDMDLRRTQAALINRFSVMPELKLSFEEPISMEVYRQQKLQVIVENTSAESIVTGLMLARGLPVKFDDIQIRRTGIWYQGVATLNLVAR